MITSRQLEYSRAVAGGAALHGPGSAVGAIIRAALVEAGVSPRLRFETREYRTARILASAGLAVAILPRSVAEEPGHPIHILRLDPELRWSPVLGWSATRRPGPAVSAFIEYAVERLQARAEIGQSSNARQASRARGAPASGASPS